MNHDKFFSGALPLFAGIGGYQYTDIYRQKTMSSLFLSDCYPALGGRLCGKSSLFPKHKRTLLVGKGPTFRLYAGALIERCFNAVLATHKGLIMPAEAMSFLFCSGSCKQSTRNFPHTCETSTGSNTVISRLASAVRNGTPVDLDRLRQDSESYWES